MAAIKMHESVSDFTMNSNTFPLKLWSLANDPQNSSVFWSRSGDLVIINQQQFELELMFSDEQKAKVFRTTNFKSFIRQLNLYGFRKIYHPSRDGQLHLHCFHNPNFKKGQPELLVNLKRLTVTNKAKILSGEKVYCRAMATCRQKSGRSICDEKKGSVHPYQYHGTEPFQLRAYDRTSIPPRYSDTPPFYTNYGIPVSVIRQYPPDPLTTMLLHQEPKYIPHPSHYTPGFSPQVIQCQCYTSCFMEADRTGPDQYLYSRYGYFPNHLMSDPRSCIQTPAWTPNDKGDVNLDRVFQMVDEFQASQNVHMVRAGTPVKAGLYEHSQSTLYTLSPVSELESLSFQSSRSESVSVLDPHHFAYIRPEQRTTELAASAASLKKVNQVFGLSAEDHRMTYDCSCLGVGQMARDVPQQTFKL